MNLFENYFSLLIFYLEKKEYVCEESTVNGSAVGREVCES